MTDSESGRDCSRVDSVVACGGRGELSIMFVLRYEMFLNGLMQAVNNNINNIIIGVTHSCF